MIIWNEREELVIGQGRRSQLHTSTRQEADLLDRSHKQPQPAENTSSGSSWDGREVESNPFKPV